MTDLQRRPSTIDSQQTGQQMTSGLAVTARDVSMTYTTLRGSQVVALDGVDLDVNQGEFISLIGPSGCGKSTLLYAMGGLRKQTGGEIRVGGEVVRGPNPKRIGFVFQDYTLFPWRTIISNIEVGLEFRGTPKKERQERAQEALNLVGLGAFAQSYPSELSGGMQQRVAIARALALDPEILLMDEPFGALDEQTRTELGMEVAAILERTGKTIIFVTHSLGEAVFLSDRVVVMSARPGRVKAVVTVDQPRPRTPDFQTSETFAAARNTLFEMLHEEIVKSKAMQKAGV
jgi:NitT/TauT family transport system ATP-binding protein